MSPLCCRTYGMCYICFRLSFLSKVLSFFSLGTPASFHVLKTDSDHCAGMTYSFPVCDLETRIKTVVSGVSCQAGNILSPCPVACGSEPKIVSEYDQEIPQSQTAETLWHREEEPLNHHETPGSQIKQSNQQIWLYILIQYKTMQLVKASPSIQKSW